ncbi:down syndrome cell adhesion molecule-like protein Dscam2 [Trichonephila clavipes]|nr:down syndrome cell adhesion molecule-like protein Dscam2 [Trichonephila clavipes]
MDVCKCIVSSLHGATLNSRRAACPLARLLEEEERSVALQNRRVSQDVAPVLKHTFEPAKVEPGSALSLKCIASGNPLPQVTWTLDDLAIPDHMRFSVGDYVTSKAEVVSFVNISTLRVEDGDPKEDITLIESDCEESEEGAEVIDNVPVNADIYVARYSTEWCDVLKHVYAFSSSRDPPKPVLRMPFPDESIRNVGERDSRKPFSPTSSGSNTIRFWSWNNIRYNG